MAEAPAAHRPNVVPLDRRPLVARHANEPPLLSLRNRGKNNLGATKPHHHQGDNRDEEDEVD